MQVIDRDIHQAKALIIDANPTSRSVLAGQLRDLGVLQVRQMSRVQDARLALEESPYDIVLCEMTFDGAPMSGQDLLGRTAARTAAALQHGVHPGHRRGHLFAGDRGPPRPRWTATWSSPIPAWCWATSWPEVRRRKRTLKPIYEAIQTREFARAAALAEVRFNARESYWTFSAQVAAELWLPRRPAAARR